MYQIKPTKFFLSRFHKTPDTLYNQELILAFRTVFQETLIPFMPLQIKHLLFLTISFILLNSCQTRITESKQLSNKILRSTVSVNFAADGRLWRLTPTRHTVYVDYSNDNGNTYNSPVRVNKQDQTISVWPENPAAIEISPSGRINVLYYADEQQKSTSLFSYSDDNGQTFSPPVLISDQAETALHYMDKMLIDKHDNTFLFWHDSRHDSHNNKQVDGVLSLYYSQKTALDHSAFKNQLLSNDICSCCRTATELSQDQNPVVFARMVFNDGIRDHALIAMNTDGSWNEPQRITFDNWKIEACPEHGPALAIDDQDRTHLTWFTLGDTRQGIFYAQTDDFGKHVSTPMALGNPDRLPSHPDVITLAQRVVIVWKEFDGEHTSLHIKESTNRGKSWADKATVLSSNSKNSHPKLISNNSDIFLSWTTENQGHQMIKLP